jgi:hypothetical protein
MKPINYICRFPFAVIICIFFSIILLVAFLFEALFMNWSETMRDFKGTHTDIYDCYKSIMGL